MSGCTPTLGDIVSALQTELERVAGAAAVIIPPGGDAAPDAGEVLALHAVNPGAVSVAELGGRGALSVMKGTYSVNLSYPADSPSRAEEAWNLAQRLMTAFRREEFSAGAGALNTDEPFTTNVGKTSDGRMSLLVTVPWWAWTGAEEGE